MEVDQWPDRLTLSGVTQPGIRSTAARPYPKGVVTAMRPGRRIRLDPKHRGLTVLSPDGPRFNGTIRLNEKVLTAPLGWKKPQKIFVNSMSDLFHDGVPDEFIDRVMAVVALCPQHTFIVLTKRPKRMREYVTHRCSVGGSWHVTGTALEMAAAAPETRTRFRPDSRSRSIPFPTSGSVSRPKTRRRSTNG